MSDIGRAYYNLEGAFNKFLLAPWNYPKTSCSNFVQNEQLRLYYAHENCGWRGEAYCAGQFLLRPLGFGDTRKIWLNNDPELPGYPEITSDERKKAIGSTALSSLAHWLIYSKSMPSTARADITTVNSGRGVNTVGLLPNRNCVGVHVNANNHFTVVTPQGAFTGDSIATFLTRPLTGAGDPIVRRVVTPIWFKERDFLFYWEVSPQQMAQIIRNAEGKLGRISYACTNTAATILKPTTANLGWTQSGNLSRLLADPCTNILAGPNAMQTLQTRYLWAYTTEGAYVGMPVGTALLIYLNRKGSE